MVRTKDKFPIVRCQAVNALSRLQNPMEDDDEVTEEYLRLLASDSSS
jgi:hypothetical protein